MLLLITLYLLLVVVLPLGLSAIVSYRTLPTGSDCPLCRGETFHILSRWLRWAGKLSRTGELHRRWCPGCGWEGVCRIPAIPQPLRATTAGALLGRAGARPDMASMVQHTEPGRTIELRRLDVDGREWRVLLQCWRDRRGWHGRLVFVSSSGRPWSDETAPIEGESHDAVVSQALTFSDQFLTGRLRELVSD